MLAPTSRAAPTENDHPQSFAGRGELPLTPFWKSIANTLEGSPAEACIGVKNAVKRKYLHTTISDMFDLAEGQFEEILDAQPGADKAWRPTIEKYGGFKFRHPNNAMVLGANGVSLQSAEMQGKGQVKKERENTLFEQLGKAYVNQIIVPRQVTGIVTLAVGKQLSKSGSSQLANAFALWVFCLWGKFNVGIEFIRTLLPQFAPWFGEEETEKLCKVFARKLALLERSDASVRSAVPAPTCSLHACYMHEKPLAKI